MRHITACSGAPCRAPHGLSFLKRDAVWRCLELIVMSIESLEKELEEIELKMQPLRSLREKRKRQLATEKSKKFIRENGITKELVQRCDDDGMPWMGDVYKFGEWMATNSTRPWCCWNGLLYKSQEIIAGRMEREALGQYEDLNA
jgi:hypothetical protein